MNDNRLDPTLPYGQHIWLTCVNHPHLLWSTKNIDHIGARSLFYHGTESEVGNTFPATEECDCPITDLRQFHPVIDEVRIEGLDGLNDLTIQVVPDQACPGCGAYSGHPDASLNFPNRPKVDDNWKCYNPDCEVWYYKDGEILESGTPEEAAAIHERIHKEVADLMERSRWISKIDSQFPTSKCIPKDAPLPDGWREGVS